MVERNFRYLTVLPAENKCLRFVHLTVEQIAEYEQLFQRIRNVFDTFVKSKLCTLQIATHFGE